MPLTNRIKLLVVIIIVAVLGWGAFLLTKGDSSKTTTGTQTNDGSQAVTKYDGFDTLIDYGLSSKQLVLAEQSTAAFVKANNSSAQAVTVNSDSIQTADRDPSSEVFGLLYQFSVDQTVYSARLNYIGLHAIQLYVSDATGQQVYDSGLQQTSSD